jgi:tetratricopeptide (TPR) repeat protein
VPGALAAYTESKNIADKLATADPSNVEWRRDLSVSWSKLGDMRSAQGDLPGALAAYTESKNIADKLATADPGNAVWQFDLGISNERIGNVLAAQRQFDKAAQAYQSRHDIIAKLAATDPGNAGWQRDLIVSHWKLADLSERVPDRAGDAAGHWAQALAIARTLADSGRLAPTDAWFVATLEQRLAAARAGRSPPP